jgi:hypothetical protein
MHAMDWTAQLTPAAQEGALSPKHVYAKSWLSRLFVGKVTGDGVDRGLDRLWSSSVDHAEWQNVSFIGVPAGGLVRRRFASKNESRRV